MTIHRHASSGSSFGANPLEQTIGLGKADRVATIEVHWPTSGATQVVRDVPAGGVIEITESAEGYRRIDAGGPGHAQPAPRSVGRSPAPATEVLSGLRRPG